MSKSHLTASIKKIEIINKVIKDEWQQSIRIILGDIELNNETLVDLRRFRPDETVNVIFEAVQLELFSDKPLNKRLSESTSEEEVIGEEEEIQMDKEDELLIVEEGDITLGEDQTIEKEFEF